jgi:hypothetical protein
MTAARRALAPGEGQGIVMGLKSPLIISTMLCMLAAAPAIAITVHETPLEITGFMDLQFTTDEATPGERDFRLGQAELDFSACLSGNSCACVAVAYDPYTETFGLGAATIEFLVAGRGSDCRHHYEKWQRSGFVVGQFDIPFGIDWLVYPSVDRRTITAPDAVAATHAGWNELGVGFFIEADRYTLRAWLANGLDGELATGADEPVPLATESSVGARASVLPAAGVECGVSVAEFAAVADDQAMTMVGVDAQAKREPWAVKAEYISHRLDFGAGAEFTNRGGYAQGTRDFTGWYLFGRYDNVDVGQTGLADLESVSGGLGLGVAALAELRLEYRAALDDAQPDLWLAQLVAAF